jgi:hypothetical protein
MIFTHFILWGKKMDNFIAKYNFEKRGELNYCLENGIAYQANMDKSVPYGKQYFEKYLNYETAPIGKNLNKARLGAVYAWAKDLKIIDVGIGCGSFIKKAMEKELKIWGFDINPYSINWLKNLALYDDPAKPQNEYFCYTYWDSLEHIPNPQNILSKILLGAYVFISIPIFKNLEKITYSKHYRPNEHYYYFTTSGLIQWLNNYDLQLIKIYDFEERAGRQGIGTFLFEKRALKKKNIEALRDYFRNEELLCSQIGRL